MRCFVANASSLIGIASHNQTLSGDTVTTLFVNYQWRRLISEALQLYFDNRIYKLDDPDFEDVHNKFQSLLNDLYTPDTISMPTFQRTAFRALANQSILAATSPNAVIFDTGSFDGSNPTRVITPQLGFIIITAQVHVTFTTNQQMSLIIRRNGMTFHTRDFQGAANTAHLLTASYSDTVDDVDDYFELLISHTANGTIATSLQPPKMTITVVPYG